MFLNPNETYQNKDGRNFRVIGISKKENTEKWIDGKYRSHWIVDVKFLDNSETKSLFYDYQDKLYKITNLQID